MPLHRPEGPALRALVIDDNQDAADSLVLLLSLWGASAHAAYDARAGLEAARTLRPDVALVDLGLPGATGFDLASDIVREGLCPPRGLVAVTGHTHLASQCAQAGFAECLLKPVEPEYLLRVVTAVVAGRSLPGV